MPCSTPASIARRSLGTAARRRGVGRLAGLLAATATLLLAFVSDDRRALGFDDAPDFVRDIRPIFQAHCYRCHAGDRPEGGLRLDLRGRALAGGDSLGPAIVPGDAARSPLLQVLAPDADLPMPPADSEATRPTDDAIATIAAWIDAGAVWPDGVDTATESDPLRHWSFLPIADPTPPTTNDPERARGTIDTFVMARLDAAGLAYSSDADRRELLRRVTLDLTGLPPTIDDLREFLADDAPDAYERVVDRLLASPRFGERMAQHWLDVVRYADTHGYEVNTERPNAWPYRDWCIEAFDADLPFDEFIRRQIAGDLRQDDRATGFLVTAAVLLPGQIGADDVSKRAARQDALGDIVTNVGEAFLGLSVGCARCHDHKFDPISQRDYYTLQAFVSGVTYEDRPRYDADFERRQAEAETLRLRLAEIDHRLLAHLPIAGSGLEREAIVSTVNHDRIVPTLARRVRFSILETNLYEPCLDELEAFDSSGRNVALATQGAVARASGSKTAVGTHELPFVNDGRYGNASSWMCDQPAGGWIEIEFPQPTTIERITWGRDRNGTYDDRTALRYRIDLSPLAASDDTQDTSWTTVADHSDRRPRGEPADAGTPPETANGAFDESPEVTALRDERRAVEAFLASVGSPPQIFGGRFGTPDPVHLLNRGDAEQPLEEVGPRTAELFDERLPAVDLGSDTAESERRAKLADWLAHPDHPLSRRVIANRLWQWHFGIGLVETSSDLGRMGTEPSHPELLDHLASRLLDADGSLKQLHRMIVRSTAYRQSHRVASPGAERDTDARLLWRFPQRRLEAEAIRDGMLAVSGRLNLQRGGPGFDLFGGRGGLSGFPILESFDAAGCRRMIYAHKIRMEKADVFGAFDCPDAGQSTARRRQSTTPIQALALFNSPFAMNEGAEFAKRIRHDLEQGDASDAERIAAEVDRAFELALARRPDDVERKVCEALVRDAGLEQLCRVLFNSNEFLFLP
ncbi:MAG TPA: PSD1 and planctomycete cytochrome C domain-containing protein [Pirellulaceae bacterium]|nr:PSD1 and planctomycete cytochrome C domain-containing protein [Pirellulaceae bacterium]